MKKFISVLVGLSAGVVLAEVPHKASESFALGAATIENTKDYVVWTPKTIDVSGVLPASATGTVKHVEDSVTNTVATITVASGLGTTVVTNGPYLFKGGKLVFSGFGTNAAAGTVRVVFTQYP